MKLAIVCNDVLKEAVLHRGLKAGVEAVFIEQPGQAPADAGAIIDLLFENEASRVAALAAWLPRPVLVHSVVATLAEIGQPFIRLNAWPGFLLPEPLEIAALPGRETDVQQIFMQIGWKYHLVPDIAGLISARVIAMIINEAWFTYGDGISTREEIDIAMKSGTNYPYGPFEWGEKIGLRNICRLLTTMSGTDNRYRPAPVLEAACAKE